MDRLALQGMACMCRIGVTAEERREPQKLEIDLDLYADLEQAGRRSDLARTIDYREVSRTVRALLEATTYDLIEAAAVAILDRVFDRFSVERAVVRVRKFVLPGVSHIEVQMDRTRHGSR